MPAQTSQADGNNDQNQPDFGSLVENHYQPLYRFALSLCHTESDAADLVQETFLTWAEKGHQLQDARRAKAWLFTTLHRFFLERHRRLVRFPQVELTTVESELPNTDPEFLARCSGREVVAMLTRVEPQFQAAVALFYLEEYSYDEIAAVLDVPLGTVKSRLSRGIKQLRELMRDPAPVQTEEQP